MIRKISIFGFILPFLCACSTHSASEGKKSFLSSGTIVISRSLPTATAPTVTAPGVLLGYIPPTQGFLPAENETWVEIDTSSRAVQVFKGDTKVKAFTAEGVVSLKPGTYALQHKQKRPLWYATDEYFIRRGMPVPPAGDRTRYRRGALGNFALYPTNSFAIHSAPVWSEDVGGLRVSKADLASIYYLLPVGTSIVVK